MADLDNPLNVPAPAPARTATPAKPPAQPAMPAKPPAQTATPAKPPAQTAMPAKPPAQTAAPAKPPADPPKANAEILFEEETYLRLNPDVRVAVAAGKFRNGREHFERYGRAEGRLVALPANMPRDRVVMTANPDLPRERPKAPACAVDTIRISHSGGIFIIGWINDALDRVDSADLYFTSWSMSLDGAGLGRWRRPDAEAALNNGVRHPYGFWSFFYAARRLGGGLCTVVLRMKSGAEASFMLNAELIEDHEMRKMALGHLANTDYFGTKYFEAVAAIERGIAPQLVDFNKMLSRRAVNAPYVERFGAQNRAYRGSIIVCLYGKVEYMFLQAAMFSRQPGMAEYEFIYVVNSPWIAEQTLKEAKLCALIYGLDITVIILNSNGGFGAANNIAAQQARSARLLIMNPDVFPRAADWVSRHSAVLEERPDEQTALFGAPLYYDDGSLMHAGLYFDLDRGLSFRGGKKQETELLRVEHYGKGAPPGTVKFLEPRAVPGVTGAFISADRAWFEKLGGFTTDYVFGHYEDADLCLKSFEAGRAAWLHDLKLWHLEGKGSERRPQHEGGSVVNRWLFTKTWGETVREGFLGMAPAALAARVFPLPAPEPQALQDALLEAGKLAKGRRI